MSSRTHDGTESVPSPTEAQSVPPADNVRWVYMPRYQVPSLTKVRMLEYMRRKKCRSLAEAMRRMTEDTLKAEGI